MPKRDTRWLLKRGDTWHVQKAIPRPLHKVMGKRRFILSLQTGDHATALSRRYGVLAAMERQIAAAREPTRLHADDRMQEALRWRQGASTGWRGIIDDPNPARHRAEALSVIQDISETIAEGDLFDDTGGRPPIDPKAEAAGRLFYNVATGAATPLDLFLDKWLAEGGKRGPLKARTANQYRSDCRVIFVWLQAHGAATLEAISPALVGEYVTGLLAAGDQRRSINRRLVAIMSYWRWLQRRGHVPRDRNPWSGQSVAPPKGKTKREFTDDELRALLAGPAPLALADAMRTLALTGLRVSELANLTTADCIDGWFVIREGKTDAAARRIPIHRDLAPMITRRTAGRIANEHVFGPPGARPGQQMSTLFIKYRRKLGIGGEAGRALTDLHSLRRWFATKARARNDLAVVQSIMGHTPGNITDSTYASVGDDARIACVNSVGLPIG
jgi:integrase